MESLPTLSHILHCHANTTLAGNANIDAVTSGEKDAAGGAAAGADAAGGGAAGADAAGGGGTDGADGGDDRAEDMRIAMQPRIRRALLPARTALSMLDAFAASLVSDRRKLARLKADCLASINHADDIHGDGDVAAPATGPNNIASTSSDTLLAYMMHWAIKHLQKAAAYYASSSSSASSSSPSNSYPRSNAHSTATTTPHIRLVQTRIDEHLEKAERMLHSLIMGFHNIRNHLELDESADNSRRSNIGSSSSITNAPEVYASDVSAVGIVAAAAHLFLALVWNLRIRRNYNANVCTDHHHQKKKKKRCRSKNNHPSDVSGIQVASHLLQAFAACPKSMRITFAPQLWDELFRPHLSDVEVWYSREREGIDGIDHEDDDYQAAEKHTTNMAPAHIVSDHDSSQLERHAGPCGIRSRLVHQANYPNGSAASKHVNAGNANYSRVHTERQLELRPTMFPFMSEGKDLIGMRGNLLTDLYNRALDDGTQGYARSYQDLISNHHHDSTTAGVSSDSGPSEKSFVVSDVEDNESCTDDGDDDGYDDGYDDNDGDDDGEQLAARESNGHTMRSSSILTQKDFGSRHRIGHYIFRDESSSNDGISTEESVNNHEFNMTNEVLKRSTATKASVMKQSKSGDGTRAKGSSNSSLSLAKKTRNSTASNQINLLQICTKVHRPEVMDPLRKMLNEAQPFERAKSARGRSTMLKMLLSPQRHSVSGTTISGRLAASDSKMPRTNNNSHSIRLIDLMAQQQNSGSDSNSDRVASSILHTTTKHNSCENAQRRQHLTRVTSKAKGDGDQRIKTSLSIKGEKSSKKRTSRMDINSHHHNAKARLRQQIHNETKMASDGPVTSGVNTKDVKLDNTPCANPRRLTQSKHKSTDRHVHSKSDQLSACCRPPTETIKPKHKPQENVGPRNIDRTSVKMNVDDPPLPLGSSNLVKSGINYNQPQSEAGLPPTLAKASTSAKSSDSTYNAIKEMATRLEDAVAIARIRLTSYPSNGMSSNMVGPIFMCEQALIKFTDKWLNLRIGQLMTSKDQVHGSSYLNILDDLVDEFLYVLGVSELKEVQTMALCLVSSITMSRRKMSSSVNPSRTSAHLYRDRSKSYKLESGFPSTRQLSSDDPQVLQALSNLLKQPSSRLPEAAMLLHLLQSATYTKTCDHHLPHLLPLLLELVPHQHQSKSKEDSSLSKNSIKSSHLSSPSRSPLNQHPSPHRSSNSPNARPRSNSPKHRARQPSPCRSNSTPRTQLDPRLHSMYPSDPSKPYSNSNILSPHDTKSYYCSLPHNSNDLTSPHNDMNSLRSILNHTLKYPSPHDMNRHRNSKSQVDPHQTDSQPNAPLYPCDLHQNPLYQSSKPDRTPSDCDPIMVTPHPSSGHGNSMALRMIAHLLQRVDSVSRKQACKHILLSKRSLPFLLLEKLMYCSHTTVKKTLVTELQIEEKMAIAYILTSCIQSDYGTEEEEEGEERDKEYKAQERGKQENGSFRSAVVKRVGVCSLLHLLQICSSASIPAFEVAIAFVFEVLCPAFRRLHMKEILPRDDMFNCMHALMSYIQLAPPENQSLASGLLLQLDLLLGDEQRYNIFREEAIDTLLTPLLCDTNEEATLNATHILCTIGSSRSQHELESWLLKQAGLASSYGATQTQTRKVNPLSYHGSEEEEDNDTLIGDWDEVVSRALIAHKRGLQVSCAIEKGLKSQLGVEVHRACLLVVAWLTSHLTMNSILRTTARPLPNIGGFNNILKLAEHLKQLAQAIQPHLRSIAAIGSPYGIEERVLAALALENLGVYEH